MQSQDKSRESLWHSLTSRWADTVRCCQELAQRDRGHRSAEDRGRDGDTEETGGHRGTRDTGDILEYLGDIMEHLSGARFSGARNAGTGCRYVSVTDMWHSEQSHSAILGS